MTVKRHYPPVITTGKIMLNNLFGNKKNIFIAEIGLNHNGDIAIAEKMIEKAAEAGADAVKFQTFIPELMNSPLTASLLKGDSLPVLDNGITDFFRKLTFSADKWIKLKKKAEDCEVVFFSTPFDIPSVELLEKLDVKLYKIASSEVTNPPLLKTIASTGKPVIISTGMSTPEEIKRAIELLEGNGSGELVILHCVSLYPADDSEANLRRIVSLKENFGKPVGISDHSRDYASVMIASAFGATVFEKHFKLSDDHDCPDKDVSLTPGQFSEMVAAAGRGALMAGSGRIEFTGRESDTARGAKRSLFAYRDIDAESILSEKDIICLRPGVGIPASDIYNYIGLKVKVKIKEGSLLKPEFFNNRSV